MSILNSDELQYSVDSVISTGYMNEQIEIKIGKLYKTLTELKAHKLNTIFNNSYFYNDVVFLTPGCLFIPLKIIEKYNNNILLNRTYNIMTSGALYTIRMYQNNDIFFFKEATLKSDER